jgi:hypothetical protein
MVYGWRMKAPSGFVSMADGPVPGWVDVAMLLFLLPPAYSRSGCYGAGSCHLATTDLPEWPGREPSSRFVPPRARHGVSDADVHAHPLIGAQRRQTMVGSAKIVKVWRAHALVTVDSRTVHWRQATTEAGEANGRAR